MFIFAIPIFTFLMKTFFHFFFSPSKKIENLPSLLKRLEH